MLVIKPMVILSLIHGCLRLSVLRRYFLALHSVELANSKHCVNVFFSYFICINKSINRKKLIVNYIYYAQIHHTHTCFIASIKEAYRWLVNILFISNLLNQVCGFDRSCGNVSIVRNFECFKISWKYLLSITYTIIYDAQCQILVINEETHNSS